MKHSRWGWMTLVVLAIWLAGIASVRAGAGGGGGGGGGGFGGGFGAGGAAGGARGGTATGASTRDYGNTTLPGQAIVSLDADGHGLVVQTDVDTFAQLSGVVSNLDAPKPQVLIKVVLLEVQHDNDLDVGVEGSITLQHHGSGVTNANLANLFGLTGLGLAGQTIGQSTMPPGAGLYSIMGNDFSATLRAIASLGKVEVLSRPSIMVRNNQPATITIGQSVPLISGVSYPSTASGPVTAVTYSDVGIILSVTPFISKNGMVEMIVAPQISSLSSQTVQIATNVNVPVIDKRSANTVVVTPDGQTAVIGGLMENDKTTIDSKIPFLGDIPLLGVLFRHKQTADTKKELIIFLTPHIVTTPTEIASTSVQARGDADLKGTQAFSDKELDRYLDVIPVKTNTTTSVQGNGIKWPEPVSK